MKAKKKSILVGLLTLVLLFNSGIVSLAEETEEIYIDLEVGETYFEEDTGMTIIRLEDDHYPLTGIQPRASKHLWERTFNGEDFYEYFNLTRDMKWWKVAFRTYNDGTSMEVYGGGKGTVYRKYKFDAGSYEAIKSDPAGRYTVQFWNATKPLDGWAACRIGDSKNSVK